MTNKTSSLKEIFDRYKDNYERRGGGHFRTLADVQAFHLDRLPRWINRINKNANILDAGCATGYQLGLLYQAGWHRLTGIDISEELLQEAGSNLPPEIKLHHAEIGSFLEKTPDKTFDVILFHHVIEHIPRDQIINLLRELRRCLADNGCLSIKTPNAACLLGGYHGFGDITHLVQFNEFSLLQVLEQAGFSIKKVEFILHPPKLFWSRRHPLRALMRMLNRARWHLNNLVHFIVCILLDLRPALRVTEWEIEILVQK